MLAEPDVAAPPADVEATELPPGAAPADVLWVAGPAATEAVLEPAGGLAADVLRLFDGTVVGTTFDEEGAGALPEGDSVGPGPVSDADDTPRRVDDDPPAGGTIVAELDGPAGGTTAAVVVGIPGWTTTLELDWAPAAVVARVGITTAPVVIGLLVVIKGAMLLDGMGGTTLLDGTGGMTLLDGTGGTTLLDGAGGTTLLDGTGGTTLLVGTGGGTLLVGLIGESELTGGSTASVVVEVCAG